MPLTCGTGVRASAFDVFYGSHDHTSEVWYRSQSKSEVRASAYDMWYGDQGQVKAIASAYDLI